MIKLKDILLEKKTISVDTAQDMRKAGYWILVSNNLILNVYIFRLIIIL